jgi:hypothetical protein
MRRIIWSRWLCSQVSDSARFRQVASRLKSLLRHGQHECDQQSGTLQTGRPKSWFPDRICRRALSCAKRKYHCTPWHRPETQSVIVAFDTMEHAKAWDASFAEVHTIADKAAMQRRFILEGLVEGLRNRRFLSDFWRRVSECAACRTAPRSDRRSWGFPQITAVSARRAKPATRIVRSEAFPIA